MIPKIVHYCWFGRGEMPKLNKACFETWNDKLPDYEFILWNEDNCPKNDFIEYHLSEGNWAFVSDYVRLYALYNQGGIYLDTDFEIVQPLDNLLSNNAFLGYEDATHINNAIAGTVKENIFFKHCMDYMLKRFEQNESFHISPVVTTAVFNSSNYDIKVYDRECFYPYNPYDDENPFENLMYKMITKDTYAIHHWAKSWEVKKEKRKGIIGLFCSMLRIILKRLDK
jgi:mannosyltransferase OCH1-like enzyme